MKKLRKLNFTELTKTEMKQVNGGWTDPNPWQSSVTTHFMGVTFTEGQPNKTDNLPDEETKNDYQSDYA